MAKVLTPFEATLQRLEAGTQKAPSVNFEGKNVNPVAYSMIVHKFNLSIMSKGMKCRGITFTQIKKFYGLKGRTAADVLPQFIALMEKHLGPQNTN